MARIDTFALQMNSDERRILATPAQRFERSQSDAVRLLIREVARELVCDSGGQLISEGQPAYVREVAA
jgi:hypothetical protein